MEIEMTNLDGVAICTVSGELNSEEIPKLHAAVRENPAGPVVIDLSNIGGTSKFDSLDGVVLSALMPLVQHQRGQGHGLGTVLTDPVTLKVLKTTGLAMALNIQGTREQAIASVR